MKTHFLLSKNENIIQFLIATMNERNILQMN